MLSSHDNLAASLLARADERDAADRIAVRQGDRSLSYRELADKVARMSSALRSLGIERGDRVAILMRDTIEAAVAILGAIHMGATAVPIGELARAPDIAECLSQSGAVAVVVDTTLEAGLAGSRTATGLVRHVIRVPGPGGVLARASAPGSASAGGASPAQPAALASDVIDLHAVLDSAVPASEAAAVLPGQTAILLYTGIGGGRGLRGVPHAHATPMSAFTSFARGVIGLDEEDRVLAIARLSTIYGLGMGLFFPLAAGAETLLVPERPHSDIIFPALASFDPTIFLATPSVYGQLARDVEANDPERRQPLARCRACLSGAEGMPPRLVPRIRDILGAQVTVGYGLTEVFQFVFAGTAGEGPVGNVGRPVPGFEARIVDDSGQPLGASAIGVLQVRGPTVLSGYWGEAAGESRVEDGWFTTRDRFMKDEQGYYFFCGRADDLFKVAGEWVSPSEIERALLLLEEVWDCAVIGVDDEDGLIKPFAFVVPNIGHEPGSALGARLREHVTNELAPHKHPRWIEFRDKLPRGPGGKLLRYKLKPSR